MEFLWLFFSMHLCVCFSMSVRFYHAYTVRAYLCKGVQLFFFYVFVYACVCWCLIFLFSFFVGAC